MNDNDRLDRLEARLAALEAWPAWQEYREEQEQARQERELAALSRRAADAAQAAADQALAAGSILIDDKSGSRLLCATGDVVIGPAGRQRLLPIPSEAARLNNRREYHKRRLEPAEADFRELRAALSGAGPGRGGYNRPFSWPAHRYGPAGGKDGAAALERIRDYVMAEREALKEIDRLLAELPEAVERRRREQQLAESRHAAAAAASDLAARVSSVTI